MGEQRKWTPGPWVYGRKDDGDEIRRYIRGNGRTCNIAAQTHWRDTERPVLAATREADWHLMAAAPEMYEALREALRVLSDDADATPRATAREMARAALRKANTHG
jgi:hypothetical protein